MKVSIRQFAAPSKSKRVVVFLEEMFAMMLVKISDHTAQVLETVVRKLNAALGPSYMVSGTRDNPSPEVTISSVYM